MPPKANTSSGPSASGLVPVGRRDVFSKTNPVRQHGKGQKPTTSKALVLRNGKYGSQGTGELILMNRMTGREKLDLLAENLLEESKKAIMSPLNLEKCLKMAESQYDAYIDDIADLKEADTFKDIIEAEMKARADPTRDEPRKTPSYVAKLVATRIHNSYMLASAWKIVSDMLNGLATDGLTDKNAKSKLKNDPSLRARYLVLFNIVKVLVKMDQNRFSVLATTAPHYAKFFKLKPTEGQDPAEPEYVFDWKDLREIANSFLDSIIIELCFPRGIYPKSVLYRILHDAVEESPKEAKRFPQALWDAVGDLSISIELQDLLEAPLLGPDADRWKSDSHEMPEEFEAWIDAQIFSEKASNLYASFKDSIYPLEKTKRGTYLQDMWKQIDKNYISVSGLDINSLWQLEDAFEFKPQWTAFAFNNKSANDSDDEGPQTRAVVKKPVKEQKLLRLAGESDSGGSMPGLQSVSNSDDDDDDDDSSSDDESFDENYGSEGSGYDTDGEDEMREMWKEAMEAAREAEYQESSDVPSDMNPFTEEDRKGNPFLKLLGSLRGRMFNASPKLKTEEIRTEPRTATARRAFRATPSGIPKNVPTPANLKAQPAPTPAKYATSQAPAQPAGPQSQRATVEEVEDEDDAAATAAKKKKKKSKKKKRPSSSSFVDVPPTSPTPSAQSTESFASTATKASQPVSSLKPTLPSSASSFMSTSSLPIEPVTAQSGHSYLRSLGSGSDKKIKSRPDHASLFSNSEKEKRELFGSSKTKETKPPKEAGTNDAAQSWFNKLTKKTTGLMSQLLNSKEEAKGGAGTMKWEHFLRVMREMGFEYDPSTAGSSVRFDPPNKNDQPITFHKPHPDPSLTPQLLRSFGKRLKRHYGWTDEHIKKLSASY